ncbi:interferon regulatory factor 10 isoform X2 [Syngnathoides biaculeatus]|uniref:interferon regulatory factor 10 isoform X2 n=1 Tax=Syngnathoides biaculeatus TaxID=300417 RepID=UPI002ADDEB40|nr:interferon regulatory factor 10 isoform X2 [Syngnathoides biaculeatus]
MKMDEGPKTYLKEWLIAQVESGAYEGLCWEDRDKTMFRIPWKHAAKKDYKQTDDAALFKAWTLHKGKYREGQEKDTPTVWKTRLRCALNKSTDFEVVPERSQLDISEPYKVYRIRRIITRASHIESPQIKTHMINQVKASPRRTGFKEGQESIHACEEEPEEEQKEEQKEPNKSFTVKTTTGHTKPQKDDLEMERMDSEVTGKTSPSQHFALSRFCTSFQTIKDFRMQVEMLYKGQRVVNCTTKSPEGCFILQGGIPFGSERIYGPCTTQQLSFPSPNGMHMPSCVAETINRLLCHLEKGVLLWVAPDGLFIKRFCQGRVYWSGPMAPHTDRPNKLERGKTVKLLNTSTFLNDLQSCLQGKGTTPNYRIELCFGEEYPDPNTPKSQKLIMVQVLPMFAVDQLQKLNLDEMKEKNAGPVTDQGKEFQKVSCPAGGENITHSKPVQDVTLPHASSEVGQAPAHR